MPWQDERNPRYTCKAFVAACARARLTELGQTSGSLQMRGGRPTTGRQGVRDPWRSPPTGPYGCPHATVHPPGRASLHLLRGGDIDGTRLARRAPRGPAFRDQPASELV